MQFLFFFFLISLQLFSNPKDPYVLAATEGEPSLNIADCVNAITGDFVISEVDHIIPGIEPIVLRRSYLSGDGHGENGGWDFFPHLRLILKNNAESDGKKHHFGEKFRYAIVAEPNGSFATYNFQKPVKGRRDEFRIKFQNHNKGITNTSQGIISGRTNLRNNVLIDNDNKTYSLFSGDSRERIYKIIPSRSSRKLCLLELEKLPNGNQINYEYDDDDRVIFIKTTNPSGSITYAWAKFIYADSPDKSHDFNIETSDGKQFFYRFKKHGHKDWKNFYLESFSGSTTLAENHQYTEPKNSTGFLIAKRSLPNHRYVKAQYYVANKNTIIDSEEHPACDRVNILLAPVGTDESEVPIHYFSYDLSRKKERKKYVYTGTGTTKVYDFYKNKSEIQFDDELRPRSITNCIQETPHHALHFHWSKDGFGQIIGRTFTDGQDKAIWRRIFEYDDRGNITMEDFHGYKKRFASNEQNLITKVEEDNGLITYFTYLGKTDLITSKLTGDHERIHQREFFQYSQDNLLIEEISDNGSGFDTNDFNNVTVRKIKTYQLRDSQPAIGYPEWIEEKYWENGREIPLRKTHITYSHECKILQKDIYDADGVFRYSLKTTYDPAGRPIEETDAIGRVTKSHYDDHNNKTEIATERKVMHMGYDFSNRLIAQKEMGSDKLQRVTQFKYNLKGFKSVEIDPYGNKTKFEYDPFGHQTQIQTADGKITQKTYDAAGNETSLIEPNGDITQKAYNHLGQPTTIKYPNQAIETNQYNSDGTLYETIDVEGTIIRYTYDVFKRILSKRIYSHSELLYEETFTYDGFNLISKIDPEGNETIYFYDGAGRKIKETFNNETIHYFYDSLNRQYKIQTDDLIKVTEYDLLDRVIEQREEDINGNLLTKIRLEYDNDDNQTFITRWTDQGKSYEGTIYDCFKRPIQKLDADGGITHIEYDDHCQNQSSRLVQKKTTTDPNGVQTIEIHDVLGRVTSIEKRNLGITISLEELQYDSVGNLIHQISTIFSQNSPKTITTTWEYQPMKRLSKIIEADGLPEAKITQFTYTLKGLKNQIIKPDGTHIEFFYDALGRQRSILSSDKTCNYRIEYNNLHLPILMEDLNTHMMITRTYDPKGRLLEENLPHANTLKSTYDQRGRRTTLVLPDYSSIQYEYDSGYLRQIHRLDKSGTVRYTHSYTEYDQSGHLLEEKLIGDLGTVKFDIDLRGRIVGIHCPYRDEVIEKFDPNGNILARILNQQRHQYIYDPLNQLTSENNHSYIYDSHHNRIQKDNDSYQIDNLNKVLTTSKNKYDYDTNGNLITKTTPIDKTVYSYDAFDRLTSIEKPEHIRHKFTYDAWHRRLSKTTYHWVQSQWQKQSTQYFLYDGENEIGSTNESHQITELRVLGHSRGAEISAAIAIELNNKTYAPLHDLYGNVSDLISLESRTIVESYQYTAFGEETTNHNPINPWRFSSKRTDTDHNLVYFGRRYYQPDLGRWLTPDPAGFTSSLNLYAFVLNAPLTHFDLYGLFESSTHSTPFKMLHGPFLSYEHRHFFTRNDDYEINQSENKPFGRIIFTNGINYTRTEFEDSVRYISRLGGGVPVHGVFFPTIGFVGDLGRCISSLLGIRQSEVVLHLLQIFKDGLKAVGPDGKILIINHSAGAINTYLALMKLPRELRKRIEVVSIAPGKISPNGLGFISYNYARKWDIVVAWQLLGIQKGLDIGNLWFVPMAKGGSRFMDHKFTSPSYRDHLALRINQFKSRYSILSW